MMQVLTPQAVITYP